MSNNYLKRSIESILRESAATFPAVVLTGPRQAGKTTLLRHLFASTHEYVSLDQYTAKSLAQSDPVGKGSFRLFADTMEVQTFFIRYVKNGAQILQATTSTGTHVILIVKSDWFSWKIIGWKGPF